MRGKEEDGGYFSERDPKVNAGRKSLRNEMEEDLQIKVHFWVVAGIGFEPMTSGL